MHDEMIQAAGAWEARRYTPELAAHCEWLWRAGHPTWIVSCRHAVPHMHRVGARRAKVALMLHLPTAEIARQLGCSQAIVREDRKVLAGAHTPTAPTGIEPAKPPKGWQYRRQEHIAYVRKWHGRKSASVMARALGLTKNQVIGIIRDKIRGRGKP